MHNARSILTVLLSVYALHACTNQATAKTILFSDDFSNLEQWQQVRPQGATWQVRDGKAHVSVTQTFQVTELAPRADLWDTNWHNIRFELEYSPIQGTDRNLSFHFQDLNNWYEFHFTQNVVTLLHLESGTVVWSTSQPFSLENGETYTIELRLYENTIALFIDGKQLAYQVDPTFRTDYGRIALKAGTGADSPTEIAIDNVVVSEYSPADLGLSVLKQTDPIWANQEYDSAATWAEDTGIDAWGCALTSLTMIFRHYGITQVPDGTELTPQSFNAWLQTQPDGYIGEGLVNWAAGLRLALFSHNTFGTPMLAYNKITDGWQDALQTELQALRPSIIQLPGHFVVAEGISSTNPLDFAIVDPSYTFNKLSQHSKLPISIRTFSPTTQVQPSITVVSKPESTVALFDNDSMGTQTIDSLQTTNASNMPVRLTELANAQSGNYTLRLSSPIFQQTDATVFGYSSELQNHTLPPLSHIIGPNGVEFQIVFDPEHTNGSITPTTSFTELSADTAALNQQDLLSTPSKQKFSEAFTVAADFPEQSNRYSHLSTVLIEHPTTVMQDLAQAYLLQQLTFIE